MSLVLVHRRDEDLIRIFYPVILSHVALASCHCVFYSDYRLIAAKQIPTACLIFAREKKEQLIEKGIVQNFMTHLITLCDIGLINPTVLKDSMKTVYSTATS